MESRKARLRALAKLCEEAGPEDGIDPRVIRRGASRKKKHSKTPQLAKQAEVAIQMVLSASADPLLRQLVVVRVEPATRNGNLLVVLGPGGSAEDLEEAEVIEALQRADGRLRGAVAGDIHRKRVPNLAYAFAPGLGGTDE